MSTSNDNTSTRKRLSTTQVGSSSTIPMQTRYSRKRLCVDVASASSVPQPDSSITGTHINDLNEDCLWQLFEQFPLQEQIHFRIVCRHWKTIVERMCAGKQSLKLFIGRKSMTEYFNKTNELLPFEPPLRLLPIGTFNDDLVLNERILKQKIDDPDENEKRNDVSRFLSALFPNIGSLAITVTVSYYSAYTPASYDLSHLLAQWPHLRTLIVTNFPADKNPYYRDTQRVNLYLNQLECSLWKVIFKMNSLTSLYVLAIVNVEFFKKMTDSAIRKLMSRLQQLTFYQDFDSDDNLNSYLVYLSKCTKLRIKYRNTTIGPYNMFPILVSKRLQKKLAHFELAFEQDKYQFYDDTQFSFIFKHFTSLTFFQTQLTAPMSDFITKLTELANLANLVELRICFSAADLSRDLPQVRQLPVLASIKTIYLSISGPFTVLPTGKLYTAFQHIFPSLEEARVACKNEHIRNDSFLGFTQAAFPRLRHSSFYENVRDMFPASYQFMGQHCDCFVH